MNEKNVKILVTVLLISLLLFAAYIKLSPIYYMKKAIKKALNYFDTDVVANCEKILRLESGNFTSGQFLGTYSAGMEPASPTYPYGWNSLKNYWDTHPEYKPIGIKSYTENGTGIRKQFIQFSTVEAGVFTLCQWLTIFENNPGRWFSLNISEQTSYNEKISKINATFTYA
jgi:hypothetical protein